MLINFFTSCSKRSSEKESKYTYDLDEYLNINKNLIIYTEQKSLPIRHVNDFTIDRDGNIILIKNHKVLIFDNNFNFKSSFSTSKRYEHIAVNENHTIFLAAENYLSSFDYKGSLIRQYEGLGENSRISSIDTYQNLIIAADIIEKIIWIYDLSGNLSNIIKGDDKDGFIIPGDSFSATISKDKNIVIANPGKQKIEFYTDKGQFLYSWGKSGMDNESFCGCCNPVSIYASKQNELIFTYEKGLRRLKAYDYKGELKGFVISPEKLNENNLNLKIFENYKNTICVKDDFQNTIRVFENNDLI